MIGLKELSPLPLAICALLATSGCKTEITEEQLEMLPSDYDYDNTVFAERLVTRVHTSWSPDNPIPSEEDVVQPPASGFSQGFNFCHGGPQGEFDVNRAAWMSFFAANAYGHPGHVGPQLQAMGFVNPEGGDTDWAQCALDLKVINNDEAANADLFQAAVRYERLRPYLQERFIDNGRWGACAQEWFNGTDADGAPLFDGRGLPAGAFTAWLLQNPKQDNFVEFGCGGEWNFDSTHYEEGSTQAVVARRARNMETGAPPIVIVAFRGTEPDRWMDVSVDLAFFKFDLETDERTEQGWGPGWGSVHRGFFNAYMSIDEQARAFGNYFLSFDDPPQIYITGHSLGGALATLLASRILQNIEHQAAEGLPVLNLRGVYTFGSPRVGNTQFMTHFNELAARHNVTVARMRNDDDSVSNVPRFEFEHVGPMFHLLEGVPGSPENDVSITRYDDLTTEPSSAVGDVFDHDIAGYLPHYDAGSNSVTYSISDTGYFRRLHEAYLESQNPDSPLASLNHCD